VKRLALIAVLSLPAAAQWPTFDFGNWVINGQHLQQVIQDAEKATEYYQMARNAAAFVHNPAQFLAQTEAIAMVAVGVANTAGITTSQRAAQLQKMIQLQQQAMQEAQTIGAISHGNMSAIGQLAGSMQNVSAELADLKGQMLNEQRTQYYQQQRQYQNQAGIISRWRLK
jgi:hypothetical protein